MEKGRQIFIIYREDIIISPKKVDSRSKSSDHRGRETEKASGLKNLLLV